MELKYSQAIKAGIIGGIIIVILIVLKFVVDFLSVKASGIIGCGICCVWILILAAMMGTGALAVRFARTELRDLNDSLIVGAAAGAVAGILGSIAIIIDGVLEPIILPELYNAFVTGMNSGFNPVFGGIGAICICGPVLLVISVIAGAIGGAIYYMMKK